MNNKASILATLAFLLVFAQAGFAQNLGSQPNSDLTQLIAWSQMQNPKPMPQPGPDPTPLPGPPQEQPPDRQPAGQAASSDAQHQASAQTITGTIVKEDGRYVLKAADKTYQIDDQEKAKQFEGKQVKIVGSLDASTGTIRIQSIEPAS
jgi:Protein of unknown function (DUF5818)